MFSAVEGVSVWARFCTKFTSQSLPGARHCHWKMTCRLGESIGVKLADTGLLLAFPLHTAWGRRGYRHSRMKRTEQSFHFTWFSRNFFVTPITLSCTRSTEPCLASWQPLPLCSELGRDQVVWRKKALWDIRSVYRISARELCEL